MKAIIQVDGLTKFGMFIRLTKNGANYVFFVEFCYGIP